MDAPDFAETRGVPPLYFLGTLFLSLVVGIFVPLPIRIPTVGGVAGTTIRFGLAALLVAAGVYLLRENLMAFARAGEHPDPHEPTHSLITTGLYQFSRNPIYLGFGLAQAGLGLAAGSYWALGSAIVALALVHILAVLPEERYLERKFGEAYLDYKRRVRRWL